MSHNMFGHLLRLTTWGESHGDAIGGVLDGMPPNISFDPRDIQTALDARKPGRSRYTSQRQEPDQIRIMSGVLSLQDGNHDDSIDDSIGGNRGNNPGVVTADYKGRIITTGTPVAFMIDNVDARSKDYSANVDRYRPGHADYTYDAKYGIRDHQGGGRSSARETAVRVAAGAIAGNIIPDVLIRAAVTKIGIHGINHDNWDWRQVDNNPLFCPDADMVDIWQGYLDDIRKQGSSVGAVITVVAENVPVGLGAPLYGKLDQDIASALMSINAVKGVEIGAGFAAAELMGDENADYMRNCDNGVKFLSNHAGGILGGIATGEPVVVRFVVKPTSSILKPGQTITNQGENVDVVTKGRHDPCVGIRAAPVGKAMLGLVLADHFLRHRGQTGR